MKEKFKEFWSTQGLLLVTILTLGIAFIGVYLILISAKSHIQFWPAIGSWVGGVATVYAVCIAIIEYKNRKKVEGINEIIEIDNFVRFDYWESWVFLSLNQLETYNQLKSFRDTVTDKLELQQLKLEGYEKSLNKTLVLEKKYRESLLKLNRLAQRLSFLSPIKYKKLIVYISRLDELRDDSNDFMCHIDPSRFYKKDEKWASELKKLVDVINQNKNNTLALNIIEAPEWVKYINQIDGDVYEPLAEKLRSL